MKEVHSPSGHPRPGAGRVHRFFFLSAVYCFLFTVFGCSPKPYYRQTRLIMGTVIEITAQDKSAIDKAFSEIERIDALMSSYRPDSEISQLNARKELRVCGETLEVVEKAKYFYELSAGAFDITVGPLVKLWNIRENMQKEEKEIRLPVEKKIKDTLSFVGSNLIEIEEKSGIIRLKNKNAILDLGAIAKGYTVDRAVEILKQQGVNSAMVNAGGDIYCLGGKTAAGWAIGLQDPQKSNDVLNVFTLKDRAVATSGDYEQFFIHNNKRYSHIIDPRTGYPVDGLIRSVTVFADDCLTADALATAIFVLGKEEGRKLAEKFENVDIKIIDRD